MKIWGEIPKIQGVYDKQKNVSRAGGPAGVSGKKDVVSISGPAKDFQTAMKAVKEVPDIRKDKIGSLVDQYETGSYDVNGKDTADRIISSMFDSRI